MRITLIHPPDGAIPTAPYASIPHLTGALQANGHEVLACDASLEILLRILDRRRLEEWWDTADRVRSELEVSPELDGAARGELRRLQHLLVLPRSIFAEVEESVTVMREHRRFRRPEEFNRAFDVVRACSYFAFSVSPDSYTESRRIGHAILAEPSATPLPDPPLEFIGQLVEEILEEGPDAIGITTPFDGSVFFGLKFALEIKRRRPDLPVLMGGAGIDGGNYPVTSDPFYFQVLDYVMVGEGDVQLPRLLHVLEQGGDPSQVKNLRWLGEDGRVAQTDLELVNDLNSVAAPDFSKLPLERYLLPDPVATFQTSRGCYYGRCTFCSELFRKGFRVRRPELVVEDMVRIFEQSGIRHFQFWDSLAPPKTLKRIALEIKRRGLPFEWMAETKFEKPFSNGDTVRILAEGGCTFLQFGFESASSRVLDGIDKGNSIEDVEAILALLEQHGIRAGMSWFIGFPGESEREADLTYDFSAMRRDQVMLSSYTRVFSIGRDTTVFLDQERFGIEIFEGAAGVLDYAYTDGRERWSTDERDQAFHVRGDFYMLKNNIELHYATVPKEIAYRITGRGRVGPILRHVPEDLLGTVSLTLGSAVEYRIFDRNPLTGDDQSYGAVLSLVTGFRFDLDRDLIALVRALDGHRLTIGELLGKTGIAPDVALRLLDQGVNRGMFRILLAEEHLRWVLDEASQTDPLSVALQS